MASVIQFLIVGNFESVLDDDGSARRDRRVTVCIYIYIYLHIILVVLVVVVVVVV